MTFYPQHALYMFVVAGTPFIAALFVCFRVYARRKQRVALGWDDYLIIFATILSIALIPPSVLIGQILHYGLHVWQFNIMREPTDTAFYVRCLTTFNVINAAIEPLVKASVLLLLLKVSRVIAPVRKIIYCLLVFIFFTTLGPLVAYIFVCPFEDGGIVGKTVYGGLSCIGKDPSGILNISQLAVNIFTDILIFPIPIFIMHNLKNSSLRSRLTVIFSFALSLGATVIAIVRLHVTYKRLIFGQIGSDWTYDISFCLQNLENNVAILLACMPSTRSLLLGWISKSKVEQPLPGQSTVLKQPVPGEHLLFQSLVVPEEDTHDVEAKRLPTVKEGRSDSETTTIVPSSPAEVLSTSYIATPTKEADEAITPFSEKI